MHFIYLFIYLLGLLSVYTYTNKNKRTDKWLGTRNSLRQLQQPYYDTNNH